MSRTEKMIANAEAKGRVAAKAYSGSKFSYSNPYSQKSLREAWQEGFDEGLAGKVAQ